MGEGPDYARLGDGGTVRREGGTTDMDIGARLRAAFGRRLMERG